MKYDETPNASLGRRALKLGSCLHGSDLFCGILYVVAAFDAVTAKKVTKGSFSCYKEKGKKTSPYKGKKTSPYEGKKISPSNKEKGNSGWRQGTFVIGTGHLGGHSQVGECAL
jgi:hypothetical protein